MWLEQPGKALSFALGTLIVGAFIVATGLTGLHALLT